MAAKTKSNPRRGRAPERPAARVLDISLGAKLMTLSNLMRRITAMRFQRLFQLSLVEGWIVSHIGTGGPMSLDELAYRCGLNKSQMSRGVTTMVKRALVNRRRNPDNPNGVILTLTPNGRKVYREISGLWPRYNRLLMVGLSELEIAAFAGHVATLIENSRGNLVRERKLGAADDSG